MPNRPKSHRPIPPAAREPPRPHSAARGYTYRWKRYRLWFLRQHPLCQCGPECCPDGCTKASSDVDHIQPVTGPDDPLFWDETNHQALWHDCHSRKTARENGGFGRGNNAS